MRLIQNKNNSDDHAAAIAEVLEGADEISLAVAFLKEGGERIITPLLEKRLKQGATAEAFIGTDFYITEPEALEKLLGLRQRCPKFKIFLANRGPWAFHPKTYVGRKGDRVRCLIGSANLTGGAMASNDELSILAEVESKETLSRDLTAALQGFRENPRFQRLELVLDQYKSSYKKGAPKRRRFEESLPEPFDLGRLDVAVRKYRADPSQRDVIEGRRNQRKEARKVQNEIADLHKAGPLSKVDREAFIDMLCDLMSPSGGRPHHWPSSGINRHGVKALSRPKETIALFAEARKATRLGPASAYEEIRKRALKIPGVGLNMITEMLCTFAPTRFAVFNGNTAWALKRIGVATPRSRSLQALRGERYARLCESIEAVREQVGGADFNDADAFLYWLTQNPD